MQDRAIRKILLVQAIEETDRSGEALPLAERIEATRTAIGNNPPPVGTEAEAPLSSATEWFLSRRADVLLRSLRARSPGIDHVLDVAGGATSLDRGMLVIAFVIGMLSSLLDGAGGINIFAPPLVVLIAWNLMVYLWMAGPARHRQQTLSDFGGTSPRSAAASSDAVPSASTASSTSAVSLAGTAPLMMASDIQPGRSWFGDFYARRVRRRIDRLLGHSTRFNAPLAAGLRRFTGDWWGIAQPLFYARARRLLHLSAAMLALGLVVAYYVRAFAVRSAAGWEGGRIIGSETAHVLLTALYGPAALLTGIRIPSGDYLAKLRWSAPSLAGVGEPAMWVHLIAVTACLYILLPRIVAACWSTFTLWRLSRRLALPPGVVGYARTLFTASR